jgi:hypothetical protein
MTDPWVLCDSHLSLKLVDPAMKRDRFTEFGSFQILVWVVNIEAARCLIFLHYITSWSLLSERQWCDEKTEVKMDIFARFGDFTNLHDTRSPESEQHCGLQYP